MLECSDLEGWGEGHGSGTWGPGESRYLGILQGLLPPGIAWTRRTCANLTRLLAGFAEELHEISMRAEDVMDEANPLRVYELVEEWEDAFGLPGPCGGHPTDLAGRRKVLHAKMVGNRGQDPALYQQIAGALGYTDLEFSHYEPFTCQSECDDFLYNGEWQYAIRVTGTSIPAFDTMLACLFNRRAQRPWIFIFELTP